MCTLEDYFEMATIVPFGSFVPWRGLRFDLESLLEQCVITWAGGRLLPEGYEDAVVAEMDRRGLRSFADEADEALFNRGKSEQEYRRCVFAALQRLADEASRPRTGEDVANYYRACAE